MGQDKCKLLVSQIRVPVHDDSYNLGYRDMQGAVVTLASRGSSGSWLQLPARDSPAEARG